MGNGQATVAGSSNVLLLVINCLSIIVLYGLSRMPSIEGIRFIVLQLYLKCKFYDFSSH